MFGDWHEVRDRDGGQEGGDVLGGVDVPHVLRGLLPSVGHVQALQGVMEIKYLYALFLTKKIYDLP